MTTPMPPYEYDPHARVGDEALHDDALGPVAVGTHVALGFYPGDGPLEWVGATVSDLPPDGRLLARAVDHLGHAYLFSGDEIGTFVLVLDA
jgi:hypothetical protein